ncbi:hypothetical protein GIB67_007209 [Kingdonia uniflora]|uniref:WDHD1/CFT4 second beta-propeller domain-containing protein n=1 Tax=Kingdonia uniflora TaxID=39325 RepID=A0A7J7NXP6_9MAGN|nr:hypothetical protein GIB67_007209 [Kingdonia uniflora]
MLAKRVSKTLNQLAGKGYTNGQNMTECWMKIVMMSCIGFVRLNHEGRFLISHTHKESLDDVGEEIQSVMKPERTKMQECFQPGSTPVQAGKLHFLYYNMIGCITTMEHEGYSHIEVDFHDTGTGPRVPSRTDYFGFTMATLNENGSVFANPCKGDKNMSTLMYCPFNSLENNSEWSMRFESEEVKVVALGTGWVAAITSLNYLRIFTEGGLQTLPLIVINNNNLW